MSAPGRIQQSSLLVLVLATGWVAGCRSEAPYPPQAVAYEGVPRVYQAPAPQPPPSLAQIKAMSQAGTSEDSMLAQIHQSHGIYHLDANAILDLNQAKVGQRVILGLINSSQTALGPSPGEAPTGKPPGEGCVWVGSEWVWEGSGWYRARGHWVLPPRAAARWISGHWDSDGAAWHFVMGHWE